MMAGAPICRMSSSSDQRAQEIVAASESSSASSKPKLAHHFFCLPTKARLKAARQYVSSFEYNQGTETHFNTLKLRPLCRIMDTARMIVYGPQPIKCVEAVFLALYLTAGLADVDRVPLSFKTECDGKAHQHIVLLLRHAGKYGALGISRCPNLMDKDLVFDSISSIVRNYIEAYGHWNHTVLKVRVGLPVEHDVSSRNHICWRSICLDVAKISWEECCGALETHKTQEKRLWGKWLLEGKGGDPKRASKAKKAPLDTNVDMVKRKAGVPELLDTDLLMGLLSPSQVSSDDSRGREACRGENPTAKCLRMTGSGCRRIPMVMATKPIIFNMRKLNRTLGIFFSWKRKERRPSLRISILVGSHPL